MATLYVAEFDTLGMSGLPPHGYGDNGPTQAALAPPLAEQTVAIGGGSTQSASAFNARTTLIRVHADSICSIAIGSNPTAAVTNMRLAAGQTEYFAVPPGENAMSGAPFKIAVIANT